MGISAALEYHEFRLLAREINFRARIYVALFGVAVNTSILFYIVRVGYALARSREADIRRIGRRILSKSPWAPKAKLVIVDGLETAAPGECVICLDGLASFSAEDAANQGLLRFPCQHIFHESCAVRWVYRDITCPMCRQPIGNLSKCERICCRPTIVGPIRCKTVTIDRSLKADACVAEECVIGDLTLEDNAHAGNSSLSDTCATAPQSAAVTRVDHGRCIVEV